MRISKTSALRISKTSAVFASATHSYNTVKFRSPMHVNGKTTAGPLTPTLAANYRAPNRQSPQTPRLANTATLSRGPSTVSSKNISTERQTQGLPAGKESANGDVLIGAGKKKNGSSTPIAKTPTAATTAAALLSDNITPRSSARRSRTDSNKSTPTTTPTATPTPGPTVAKDINAEKTCHSNIQEVRPRALINESSGSKSDVAANRPKLQLLSSPSVCGAASSGFPATTADNVKFFYASDASRGSTGHLGQQRPGLRKAATFFYANGLQERTSPISARPNSPALSAVEREAPSLAKFCHVDEAKNAQSIISSPPSLTSSPASSAFTSPTQVFPSLRPPSPFKENIHLSYRKGVSQVIKPSCHRLSAASLPAFAGRVAPTSGAGDNGKDGQEANSRRRMSSPSSKALQQPNHVKSSSLSSVDSGTPTKRFIPNDEDSRHCNVPFSSSLGPEMNENVEGSGKTTEDQLKVHTQPNEKHLPTINPSISSVPEHRDARRASKTQMNGPDMAELAANARRERKVLDLEISNSSLLAINRQLEREVRKQKVELRRFRRLSRAGHISLGRTSSSSFAGKRCISCSTAASNADELEHEQSGVLESSWNEDGLTDSDEEDEDTSASDLSSITSHSKPHASGRLARDERRLCLDLTKHRELLIDSQRLNQGLRRCIDWTEELVRDGRRALDYKVRVSDVKLGRRVLRSEDVEQTDDEIEVRDDLDESLDGEAAMDRDVAGEYSDSGADAIYDAPALLDANREAIYDMDDDGEEIPSGGPLLSPWRSRTELESPQQRLARYTSPALPTVPDYFGTEAMKSMEYSAESAPA